MDFIDISEDLKEEYNQSVSHPLQSYEWGEFRKKTGITVIRRGVIDEKKIKNGYTVTIHRIPKLPFTIGYLPKGMIPDSILLEDIKAAVKKSNCVYVQLEPDSIQKDIHLKNSNFQILPSFHPLFTKYSFVLDLTKSEEELLKNMHPKTRYNIKVAQKHDVKIVEDNSEKGFETFLKLYEETTTRQRFYAHTPKYHKNLWELLKDSKDSKNSLSYHLLHAKVGKETLTSWVLFSFQNKLYYPYGASSREHRDKMANNLIMWEAIKLGKKLGCTSFDMWGALGENPDTKDPWYGFHKFKQGYGAVLTEFTGSYDFVLNSQMYQVVKLADKGRWFFLRLKKLI